MWQPANSLSMTFEQKNQLENWVRAPSTPQKIVLRARICLLAHEGLSNRRIARDLKTTRPTVLLWRHKQFVEKLTDVVGLYLNPPDKALVLCVDEKSQIQALDRTQPGLPMKKGRCGTMTHDYVRHGTTTLFAALNVLDGTVIGSCFDRHRHEEFLKFLRQVDRNTPDGMELHLIVDNYSTHKHPKVKQWIKRHKRFHLHFIPTSSSWLNLVECAFRRSRTPVPIQIGHSFQLMSDSCRSEATLWV